MTSVEISPLDVKRLAYQLVDGYWQVSVVDEITSTQTFLKSKSPRHGEVIAAEFQSAGRGRLDRSFNADKSLSLLFSFYVEPKRNTSAWGFIPLIAGVAVTNVLNRQSQIFTTKWPNDVLVVRDENAKKIAGILCETHNAGVVVGIGINVAMNLNQLPVDTATSMLIEGLSNLDRNDLLSDLLQEFAALFARWEGGEDLTTLYAQSSSTIERNIEVQNIDGSKTLGRASGIGQNGELLLEGDQAIYSGDVIHLYT